MGTIVTVLIIIYFIVVLFIVVEKKIDAMPRHQPKVSDDNSWNEVYDHNRRWADFSADLKSSPFIEGYDRPDMK